MSRAFVKEPDGDVPERLPELPVSPHPNYVTARGLAQLRERVDEAQRRLAELGTGDAKVPVLERELRWLHVRIGAAILTEAARGALRVAFGASVQVRDEAGAKHTYRIVGEDEGDPDHGLVSWTSPLARALLGARVGDEVQWRRPVGVLTLEVLSIG